jgi:hypothetical protein
VISNFAFSTFAVESLWQTKYAQGGKKMVSIKSPVRVKDLEGKFGLVFRELLGVEGAKKELYDNDKLLVIKLEKGECIAFLDNDDCLWELSRSLKGRYSSEIKVKRQETTSKRTIKNSLI